MLGEKAERNIKAIIIDTYEEEAKFQDDDEDFDWDDDDEDIIGGSSSADFEFDPDMYKYEDYKDFMTEDEFNEFVDEMKKYYEEYEKKAS